MLAGFVAGAVPGLFFAAEGWLGGYASWRRRLVRLAHVSCIALGMLDLLCALGLQTGLLDGASRAPIFLIAGTCAMPVVCYLSAWRPVWRHAFVVPVGLLVAGVVSICLNGGAR